MALIGEMQYLTIGGNTYSLPVGGGGTVTNVAVSNATNGGLSISGSPISSSGTITIGHSNVLTAAQTTQAVYPIKIDKNGHISAYGTAVTIPVVPTNVSAFTNDAGYLTSYTETDPVFSVSAAAGITSTDISNWNNKISDDKTWNGVELNKTNMITDAAIYVPYLASSTGTTANITLATSTPTQGRIAKYDVSAYLKSTTPSANDNSTKVATTAYVKSSIPTKVSDLTNDSGFITGVTSTSTPTASTISEYDSSAHMNSTDMSSAEVSTFVSGLNVSGVGELLKTATFTATFPVTSANTYWGLQFTGTTPTGYTPIGIISVHTGTSNAYVSGFYIDVNGVPNAFGRTTNAQGTTAPATAVVLFIKQ